MAVTDGFVVLFLHACTSEFVCIVKWPFFLVRKRMLCSSQCWHTFWFLHFFPYINYALKIWLERSVFIRENLGSNHISKSLFFLSSLFFCQFELVPSPTPHPLPDSSMMFFFLHTSVLISRRHFLSSNLPHLICHPVKTFSVLSKQLLPKKKEKKAFQITNLTPWHS